MRIRSAGRAFVLGDASPGSRVVRLGRQQPPRLGRWDGRADGLRRWRNRRQRRGRQRLAPVPAAELRSGGCGRPGVCRAAAAAPPVAASSSTAASWSSHPFRRPEPSSSSTHGLVVLVPGPAVHRLASYAEESCHEDHSTGRFGIVAARGRRDRLGLLHRPRARRRRADDDAAHLLGDADRHVGRRAHRLEEPAGSVLGHGDRRQRSSAPPDQRLRRWSTAASRSRCPIPASPRFTRRRISGQRCWSTARRPAARRSERCRTRSRPTRRSRSRRTSLADRHAHLQRPDARSDTTNWQPLRHVAGSDHGDDRHHSCGFTSKPIYHTVLAGIGSHWTTSGGSNPYTAAGDEKTQFTVYVNNGAAGVTAQRLPTTRAHQWIVQWIAVGN